MQNNKVINTVKISAAVFGLVCLSGGTALAEDGPEASTLAKDGLSFSASLTGATEYVWRGVEQSGGDPAIFGSVSAAYNGFYAGVGAENVDFLGINTEYDMWAGWGGDIGSNVRLDLTVVRYGYIDAPDGIDLDTTELKAGLSTTLGKASVGAVVHWTNDFFATEESATYLEFNGSIPVAKKLSASGTLARQFLDDDDASYMTWNAGLTYAVADNLGLDVRYIDTDIKNSGGTADSRIVAGFTASF